MRWIELGITIFILFSKMNLLTATQALLSSIVLKAASELNTYVYNILLAPIAIFIIVSLSLELVHYIHKEKTASSRNVWKHIQDLRSKQDLELLIILQSNKNLISGSDSIAGA
jgi:hypothetical protein